MLVPFSPYPHEHILSGRDLQILLQQESELLIADVLKFSVAGTFLESPICGIMAVT